MGLVVFMKEFAVELNTVTVPELALTRLSARDRAAAFVELTKPRITFLIVLTSAAGFCLASGTVDYLAPEQAGCRWDLLPHAHHVQRAH